MSGEWAQKADKDKIETKKAQQHSAEEQERKYIEKCDQTDSPEIPDWGKTITIAGLPSPENQRRMAQVSSSPLTTVCDCKGGTYSH